MSSSSSSSNDLIPIEKIGDTIDLFCPSCGKQNWEDQDTDIVSHDLLEFHCFMCNSKFLMLCSLYKSRPVERLKDRLHNKKKKTPKKNNRNEN